MVKIALDAMGGDHAPAEIVRGGVEAARELGVAVTFVGPPAAIAAELAKHPTTGLPLDIVPADDYIRMTDHAAQVVRSRRGSTIMVAANLVKDGQADALVSAGHTGAAMAATLVTWGRIPGIERPGLCILFPTVQGACLVIDIGANVDSHPGHLAQFGLMGSSYVERVRGVARPRVGLLNIGEEATKGNQLALKAHELLRAMPLHFVGNVEGKDLPRGVCDVLVCDGFVGNVAIKTAEGVAELMMQLMRDEIGKSLRAKLGALLMRSALRALRRRLDYEEYGGAPLLGVNGTAIVAHGRSRAKAITNAIRVARDAANGQVVETIRQGVAGAPVAAPIE